ncbi:MAG: ABC-F family ATP-binding cassette domain-containing protein [Patescibacteria group bacterium]|nr:ABC-F family ATP-binding cassette domain-containing protein [Patescibacteria group bacterium]
MSIVLQLQGISKSFGLRRLFDEATVSVAEGQRIGLIGANGSGKTTLLRMILGQEQLDEGKVVLHPNARLGYLEQNEVFPPNETVIDYLVRVSDHEPWECAKMAGSFEIKHEKLEAPFLSLSGGYQMRVRLAGILVREPNLLLLDEPTNYLDLQTVLLLEDVLRTYRGALLLISHDREFLKNVCTHTLELEHEKLTLFPGNIEAYFEYKEGRLEEARRYNKKIEAQRRHLQDFVDRFRYKASKATQAQSKMKQIDKLKTIEIAHSLRTVRIKIQAPPQKNALALECKDLSVGYQADKPVLEQINFEINRGEHLAVLGENGQGKSTFLKTIADQLPLLSGSYKWGHNLRVAYYAQHVPLMLPTIGTAGDYLHTAAGRVLPEDMLRMAGNFLFTKDDLEKPISVLSGGERARLCLAGICLGRYDVLVFDEPTNHLDFDTVEALGEALSEYEGTIIFVSHSRTFVSQIATSILEIKDGRAVRYPYPYEIYVYELKTHEKFSLPDEDKPIVEGTIPYMRTKVDIFGDIQQTKNTLKRIEHDMGELTKEKNSILQYFVEHPTPVDVKKAKRLKELDELILALESDWLKSQENLEAFKKEMQTAVASPSFPA